MAMDFLGTVEELAPNGNFVVRGVSAPAVGDPVFDSRERRVGTVRRVFGPVSAPYISVAPAGGARGDGMVDGRVYSRGEVQHGKGKRRGRGGRGMSGVRKQTSC